MSPDARRPRIRHQPRRLVRRVAIEAHALTQVGRAGMLGLEPPRRLRHMAAALRSFGPVGGAVTIAALRHGATTGLVDEAGSLTFGQLDDRSNALANAWRAEGLTPGTTVAVQCRNHRYLLDTVFAGAKAGLRLLFLNTDFAGPQAREVCEREGVEALVHDAEFSEVIAEVAATRGRWVAWADEKVGGPPSGPDAPRIEDLLDRTSSTPPPRPTAPGSLVILTSGTTGLPKGAARPQPRSLAIPGALLDKIPYRSSEATLVLPPLFHALGLANALLSIALGSRLVVQRRFEPGAALTAIEQERCTAAIVVPVMLQRMLDVGAEDLAGRDLSHLRILLSAGAPLGGPLALRTLEAFGDVLYNLYGSTEVAVATIATPEDLRVAPGCVGRPPFGTEVRILDHDGQPVPTGVTGRIFVVSPNAFGGYTGGGSKEVIDGAMSSGDLGHLDEAGRLFVEGRDDDMIVSGGENVFPGEVEELLVGHSAIVDAAVIGVPDETFGQRLRAYVEVAEGREVGADEVRAFVRDNLARYKTPRDVVFVDRLPRNPTGKLLKRDLPEVAAGRGGDPQDGVVRST